MFRNAKIGDRVFDYTLQEWGEIFLINENMLFNLNVKFEKASRIKTYTYEGFANELDKVPTLFWDEVKSIIPPKKPLPNLEVNTKIIVWDEDRDKKHKRYFSHFDENGNIYCFSYGKTSWTTNYTAMWSKWELAEKEIK